MTQTGATNDPSVVVYVHGMLHCSRLRRTHVKTLWERAHGKCFGGLESGGTAIKFFDVISQVG